MRIRRFIALSISIFIALGFVTTLSLSSGYAAEEIISLRLSNFLPQQQRVSLALDQWGKDLEAATGGRVKVKCYHGATLVPPVQQYDAVVKGIVDVGNHVLGYTVGRFPLTEVLDLPLGIPSGVAASKMMNDYHRKLNPKEFDDIKVLWLHGQGPGYLCTKSKPVEKMEDLQGLRIRTYGGNAKFLQSLGGSPVAMPMNEVYDALSRGLADGLLSGRESLESFRTGEHIQYITQNKQTAYTACMLVCMNKKKWDSLPADIRGIIDQLSAEQPEKFGKAWDDADSAAIGFLEKRGVNFLNLDPAEEQRWVERGAQPLFDDYVKKMKEKGLPGEEALGCVTGYLKAYKQ